MASACQAGQAHKSLSGAGACFALQWASWPLHVFPLLPLGCLSFCHHGIRDSDVRRCDGVQAETHLFLPDSFCIM